MKKRNKKLRGYTLVEVVISLAILGMILTPIYTMLVMSRKSNKDGEIKQTATLYGQEVFEEIKNEDITETKDSSTGKITKIVIGDIEIDPNTYEGEKDFKNGYKAIVKITKNSSIDTSKETVLVDQSSIVKTTNFYGAFEGENSPIKVKLSDDELGNGVVEQLELGYSSTDEVLKAVINTKTIGDKKIVEIKDGFNNNIGPPYEIKPNDGEENNQINLTLNFNDYNSILDNKKLRGVEINAYNQDNVPLNICIQKPSELVVDVYTKLGNVRVYDNRSDSSSKSGELYDINVEVTQTIKEGDTKTIFTGQASQNIKVN